jgi:hypothetical protein
VCEVLYNMLDSHYKRRLKRKFLSFDANKAFKFGYCTLADGTMKIVALSEGVITGVQLRHTVLQSGLHSEIA